MPIPNINWRYEFCNEYKYVCPLKSRISVYVFDLITSIRGAFDIELAVLLFSSPWPALCINCELVQFQILNIEASTWCPSLISPKQSLKVLTFSPFGLSSLRQQGTNLNVINEILETRNYGGAELLPIKLCEGTTQSEGLF